MPEMSLLHAMVHNRFKEVFGPPDNTLGRDHWSLKPAYPGMFINVLVNGMPDLPAVWVFDPQDRKNGVSYTGIRDRAHLEEIVQQIQDRLKRAGQPLGGK
jgi:hypothetical protein